jgi:hypothetical protein
MNTYDKMPTGTRNEDDQEWIEQFLKSEGVDIAPLKDPNLSQGSK